MWTPGYWRDYCERDDPYRRYKRARDTSLAVELLRPRVGERVLDVGCGYGRISTVLLQAADINLVAVDSSEPMLEACRLALGTAARVVRADAMCLPFRDGCFDAVLCNGVLMHVQDQASALAEQCRVLKPGARLVVSGNNALSPLALPVRAWVYWRARRHPYRQQFRSPWFYRRRLRRLGIEVRRVAGDTVLAVGLTSPRTGGALWPGRWLRGLRALDRWADRPPLSYLTYETWFLGVKAGGTEG